MVVVKAIFCLLKRDYSRLWMLLFTQQSFSPVPLEFFFIPVVVCPQEKFFIFIVVYAPKKTIDNWLKKTSQVVVRKAFDGQLFG